MKAILFIISLFFSLFLFAQTDIDTDEDGVPDIEDSCPTIKGPKENKGCQWEEMICYGPIQINFLKDSIKLSNEEKENLKGFAKALLRDIKPSDLEKIALVSYTNSDNDKNKLRKIAYKRVSIIKKYLVYIDKRFKIFPFVIKIDKEPKWSECLENNCPEWKYKEENRVVFESISKEKSN